jgi:hypothetical protein
MDECVCASPHLAIARPASGRSMTKPKHQDVPTVLHTIPLLAATCLAGFAMLQLLFSAGNW